MVMVKDMPKKKAEEGKQPPVESSEESGDSPPNTGVKLHPEFKRRLKMIAAKNGVSMGQLVQRQLEEFMSREWKLLSGQEWGLDWKQLTPH